MSPLKLVDLFKLAGKPTLDVLALAGFHHGQFDVAAERSQWRPQLVRQGRAELTHFADRVVESRERLVEGDGHVVELVPSAANR